MNKCGLCGTEFGDRVFHSCQTKTGQEIREDERRKVLEELKGIVLKLPLLSAYRRLREKVGLK